MLYFYIFAAVVVTALSAVAIYYQWRLYHLKRERDELQAQQLQKQMEQRSRVNKSIQVLASGAIEGQLTLTEASIRIGVLLDSLGIDGKTREDYSAFYLLAEKTAHIPILDEWKKLPTKKKLSLDKQRQKLEKEYGDFVIDSAHKILNKEF